MIRTRFVVRGRVQGVGFRWFVHRTASELGLVGFVQNLADGAVLCEAEGPAERLLLLARQLRIGPPASAVTTVDEQSLPAAGGSAFVVRR